MNQGPSLESIHKLQCVMLVLLLGRFSLIRVAWLVDFLSSQDVVTAAARLSSFPMTDPLANAILIQFKLEWGWERTASFSRNPVVYIYNGTFENPFYTHDDIMFIRKSSRFVIISSCSERRSCWHVQWLIMPSVYYSCSRLHCSSAGPSSTSIRCITFKWIPDGRAERGCSSCSYISSQQQKVYCWTIREGAL